MNRIIIALILMLLVIIGGTTGYILIQKWSFLDSIYMTLITISTVGFHEVSAMSEMGRIFTIILIVFGIGIGSYTIANISAFIIEGHIKNIFKGRKMEKQIFHLKKHIIVCGYGKAGIEVVSELSNSNKKFIVVETNEYKIEELKNKGVLALHGDATEEDILEKAGVHKADGLIAALSHDADNVYVVLTAREMNSKLRIVARSIDKQSCKKLLRAGADKVISPYSIAGKRMARLMLSPGIVDFLEIMAQSKEFELRIEEVILQKSSHIEHKSLRDSNIKHETGGATIIGIKKDGGRMLINPDGEIKLEENDVLFVIGNNDQIKKLHELAGKKSLLEL